MALRIRVRGANINFPDVCANDLQPATQPVTISAQRALSRHRESKQVEIRLCEYCHHLYTGDTAFHHEVEAAYRRIPYLRIVQYISGIVAFVCGITGSVTGMEILAKNRPAWPWWTAGAAVLIFAVSTYLLSKARKLSEAEAPEEEAIARRCVQIIGFAGDITDLYFENDRYAEIFQQENPTASVIVAQ